ncbi:hypothetical protein RND81_06G088800 [Saponaria officinalis]|uniref:HAT C-terminal dimerisation domain-containing protein n=1 Tax=Saponaria officinalis TaxID=3572 RepID=A0AAW1K7Q4_SAPOF
MSTDQSNQVEKSTRGALDYEKYLLWKHIEIQLDSSDGGGNHNWTCNYCRLDKKTSYSRVKAHLLGLKNQGIFLLDLAELRELQKKEEVKRSEDYITLPSSSDLIRPKMRKDNQSFIGKAFDMKQRDELDKDSRNPHFWSFCNKISMFSVPGYNPPTYNRYRTAQENTHLEKLLEPIKEGWVKTGVSICSDGWSDGSNKPIINFMATSESMLPILPKSLLMLLKKSEFIMLFKLLLIMDPTSRLQCKWISSIFEEVNKFQKFVCGHDMVKSLFNKYSNYQLLRVADTRFASHYVVAKQLIKVKLLFISSNNHLDIKARKIKLLILDDSWWEKVEYFLEFITPIYEMIREGDKDSPLLQLIYDMWDNMIEEASENQEVSLQRNLCFQRLFPDPNELRNIFKEFGSFSLGLDFFSQADVIAGRDDEEPITWWANNASSTPRLQSLAFKLLSQPASSSCCERNWSQYDNIQNIKRNRLTSSRAKDLVKVHNNLRLLARKDESYNHCPTKFWDIGGDKFDIDADIFELADFSWNDPELGSVFNNLGDEDEEEARLRNEDVV